MACSVLRLFRPWPESAATQRESRTQDTSTTQRIAFLSIERERNSTQGDRSNGAESRDVRDEMDCRPGRISHRGARNAG